MYPQLHVISTGEDSAGQLLTKVRDIHHEIDFIHLREKHWTAQEVMETAQSLIEIGVQKEKIMINTLVQVAQNVGAGGVQLPSNQHNLTRIKKTYPELIIGSSVHSVSEAVKKEKEGADLLMFGHVFASNSKRDKAPRGIHALQEVIDHVNIPVIAIGGITPNVTEKVLRTGAGGIAVLSGILKAKEVKKAVHQYKQAMEG